MPRIKHLTFAFLFGPENSDALADVLLLAQFLLPLTQFLNLRVTANLENPQRSFSSLSARSWTVAAQPRGESPPQANRI